MTYLTTNMVKIIKQTASMQTRDGVKLDADIYRPDTDVELPVLLMRQPYGREIASTVVYAHPRWYAAQGYIVVIQDVRGRGTSQGEFDLFTYEVDDALDTINWVSQLPNSTGKSGNVWLFLSGNDSAIYRSPSARMSKSDRSCYGSLRSLYRLGL